MNNLPPHGPPSALDRERDRERERDIEEQQLRERHIIRQQEEMAQREREHNERERQHREQQYQSIPQHQNNAGAIPIHQPVASRLPGAIHSPGGLLANHGASGQSGSLGAPAGPGNAFGGPLHTEGNRSIQQHNQQNNLAQQQHQMFGPGLLNHPTAPAGPHGAQGGPSTVFGGPLQSDAAARVMQQVPFGGPMAGGHQIPGAPALGQGQQPILNVSFILRFQNTLPRLQADRHLRNLLNQFMNRYSVSCKHIVIGRWQPPQMPKQNLAETPPSPAR
jgi:paired amphipathic helix protein Sin3a